MKDAPDKSENEAKHLIGDVLFDGISQAPFAVLLFDADPGLTLIWRNDAHAPMSDSVGRDVTGQPMFEAFPPSDDNTGAEAKEAIEACVQRLLKSLEPENIGPYRFDLRDVDGTFVEHHWQMTMSPIVRDGQVVSVMQVAKDVTNTVLAAWVDETLKRSAASTAAVSYFSYDPQTDGFVRSPEIDGMFGLSGDEVGPKAAPFFDRIHPDDIRSVHAELARVQAAEQGEIAAFDYRVLWPDGTERFLRIRAEMTVDPEDRRAKLVGTFVDLTGIESNRRSLAKALKFREALVAEANHRIKNSLSIASSILRMQTRPIEAAESISPEDALEVLRGVEARIRAIADVHGLMQMHQHGTSVSLCSIVERLVEFTRDSADLGSEDFSVSLAKRDAHLESDTAVSLGLILNELMTNALKYGLGSRDETQLDLHVSIDAESAVFRLSNRIVEKKRIGHVFSTHLGSRLVQQLADQLSAEVSVESNDRNYSITVTLPISA